MIAIIVLALLAVLVCVDIMAWLALSAGGGGRARRALHVGSGVVGLAAGIWCGFFLEYQVDPTLRIISFPIPSVVFHLEGGQWIDYITPAPILFAVLNVVLITAFFLFPFSLKIVIKQRRTAGWARQGLCVTCGYNLTGNITGVCPECGEQVDAVRKR